MATSRLTASQELSLLRQKLLTLEATIKEMLTIDRPTSILKEKLCQAEWAIFEIPESSAYLASEWRGKLANWYRDYSAQLAEVELPNGNAVPQVTAAYQAPLAMGRPLAHPSRAAVFPGSATAGPSTAPGYVRSPAVGPLSSNRQQQQQPTEALDLPADDLYGIPLEKVDEPDVDVDVAPIIQVEEVAEALAQANLAEAAAAAAVQWGAEEPLQEELAREYADPNVHQQPHQQLQYEVAPNLAQRQPQPQARPIYRPPPRKVASASAGGLLNAFIGTPDTTVRQVEEAIDALPVYTSLDTVDDLKKVAKLVAKVDEKLANYWRDTALQASIIGRLEAHLPADKWAQFLAFVGLEGHRTIRQLKRFLVRQLRLLYDDLKTVAEAEQAATLETAGDQGRNCNYCKSAGHTVEECAQIRFTFCYICLEDGHTQRRCAMANGATGGTSTNYRQ